MQAAASATGPIEQCGRHRHVLRRGHRGDLLAAEMPPQWARSICTTSTARRLTSRAEVGQRVQPLAGRDRQSARSLDLGQQVEALGRDRLLAPGRVKRSSRRIIVDGGAGRQPAVELDHQPDLGADGLATAATIAERHAASCSARVTFQAVPNGSNFSAR